MQATLFLLWHEHEIDEVENVLLLGMFTSVELARDAQAYFETQVGFKDHLEGFSIDETPINKRLWSEGFISWAEAMKSVE